MNIKSLSKSQYNSEFLGGMLEKHKNLIQMLDKRSRYNTFQNWFFPFCLQIYTLWLIILKWYKILKDRA